MTTPGTASTSDARKRKAERETEQPPALPDPIRIKVHVDLNVSKWLRDVARAAVFGTARGLEAGSVPEFLDRLESPPPAPAPVWSVISTDRDQPTLAWVRLGERVQPVLREWCRTDELLFSPDAHGRFESLPTCHLRQVSSVEVVRTCPETHVPVNRSLIEEAARRVAWLDDLKGSFDLRLVVAIVRSLAALADGDQS